MKVKTFTGTDAAKVDRQVNDWIEKSGVEVNKTNTTIKQFTVKGEDQVTHKPVTRRVPAIAISVWYDEPKSGKSSN